MLKLLKSRNNILILLLPLLIAVTGFIANEEEKPTVQEDVKPNIIFIMADDLGLGDLSCYGQNKFKTPNIDQAAAEGIRFTQWYSASTVCSPSRGSLLTGLHTGHGRIRGNDKPESGVGRLGNCIPLRAEDLTIAELLQKNGYQTAAFGKWGMGSEGSTGSPEKKGFHEYMGDLNQVDAHFFHTNYTWKVKDGKLEKVKTDSLIYKTDILQKQAIRFIRKNKNNPFFLYLPVNVPHCQLLAPERTLKKFLTKEGKSIFPEEPYKSKLFNNPRYDQSDPKAHFAGMVTVFDEYVGEILNTLKETGLDKNTIVFITSDNGTERVGGHVPEFFNSSAGLRGIKRDLYEGGIRVPFIAWGKGIETGKVSDYTGVHFDVFATIADFAGIKKIPATDGIPAIAVLTGKGIQQAHDFLYWEFSEKEPLQAVRKGNWKLVRFSDPSKVEKLELYDLASDPDESDNLAESNPLVVNELVSHMKEAHSKPSHPTFWNFTFAE